MINPFYNAFQPMSRPKSKWRSSIATSSVRGKRPGSVTFFTPVRARRRSRGGKLHSGKTSEELKYYDRAEGFTLTTTLASAITAGASMNSMPQGATQNTRIGNRVRVKSIQIKGYFTVTGADSVSAGNHDEFDNMVRVIVFVDHQANGALNAAGDLLILPTAINSFRELDQSDRFTVLYDKRIAVQADTHFEGTDGITSGIDKKYPFEFYKKGLDLVCQYDGTTENISTQSNNAINCFMMMEDALVAVGANFNTRVRYTG